MSRHATGGRAGGSAVGSPGKRSALLCRRRRTIWWKRRSSVLCVQWPGLGPDQRAHGCVLAARCHDTPSGTSRRDTPPAQGGIKILGQDDVDAPSIMQLVFQQSKSYVFLPRFSSLDRMPDIPVVPQKGDSTVQSLNTVTVAHGPDSALQLRSPTRSSTSLFSSSEQWRCLRFSHRQFRGEMGVFSAHFAPFFGLPREGLNPGVRIFRALDDEEFFVVEGFLGWRGRRESDSQVTCHM